MHPLLLPWTISGEVLTVLAYVLALAVAALVARASRIRGKSLGSVAVTFVAVAAAGAWVVANKLSPIESQPIPLHTYGLMIAIGFMAGIHLAARGAERYASIDGAAFFLPGGVPKGSDPGRKAKESILDLSFWVLIGAMVGARVLFIVVNWSGPNGYGANPERIFMVWTGGLVFYGGFIGATLASVWYARKHRISFRALADLVIPSVALGHFFGRMGCMAAGCCWGKVCENPDFLLGAHFPHGALAYTDMARDPVHAAFISEHGFTPALHPTQMYEGLGELGLFLLLLHVRRNKRFNGQILAMWLMLYACLRLSIETFRGDWGRGMLLRWPEVDPVLLSTSQIVGVCMLALGTTLFFLWKPKHVATPSTGGTAAPAAA